MTFTYTGDPSARDLDALRFLVGDTTETAPTFQFQDEELEYILATTGTVRAAAVVALDQLSNRYSRLADTVVGEVREHLSRKAKAYADRAIRMETLVTSLSIDGKATIIPYAGGTNRADVIFVSRDSARMPPRFQEEDRPAPVSDQDQDETC